ncbi:uncharacterized protein LOC118185278 isoform X2 [Stegodyphus dumicola]|uniref:uncharacterized protein LOC118185278 isoform X2 n=1 Tax=Stegodyphus dumicola TaxID=202533 RepID=UPI0015A82D23|nr:uncharacterized protein LOC118185278 isoform X2 [Stegodyphus dumicola]
MKYTENACSLFTVFTLGIENGCISESAKNWSTAASLIDPSIDPVYNQYIVIGVASFFSFVLFAIVGFLIIRWLKIPYKYDIGQNVETCTESEDEVLLDDSDDELWPQFQSSQLQVKEPFQGQPSAFQNMPEYDCRSLDAELDGSEELEKVLDSFPRVVISQNSRTFRSNSLWR